MAPDVFLWFGAMLESIFVKIIPNSELSKTHKLNAQLHLGKSKVDEY